MQNIYNIYYTQMNIYKTKLITISKLKRQTLYTAMHVTFDEHRSQEDLSHMCLLISFDYIIIKYLYI